ncbi:hypothetical protein Bpla01_28630 [Burkholderia plantarii]|nr:hypothetical protein Bpla01_28630 [Burkholderia plantarii]
MRFNAIQAIAAFGMRPASSRTRRPRVPAARRAARHDATAHQRNARRPASAPISAGTAIPSEYQTAQNGTAVSGQRKL